MKIEEYMYIMEPLDMCDKVTEKCIIANNG